MLPLNRAPANVNASPNSKACSPSGEIGGHGEIDLGDLHVGGRMKIGPCAVERKAFFDESLGPHTSTNILFPAKSTSFPPPRFARQHKPLDQTAVRSYSAASGFVLRVLRVVPVRVRVRRR